jgi:hypothetical protein
MAPQLRDDVRVDQMSVCHRQPRSRAPSIKLDPRSSPIPEFPMADHPERATKICPVCGRPFQWRKKWKDVWQEVRYCSERCRRRRRASVVDPLGVE